MAWAGSLPLILVALARNRIDPHVAAERVDSVPAMAIRRYGYPPLWQTAAYGRALSWPPRQSVRRRR